MKRPSEKTYAEEFGPNSFLLSTTEEFSGREFEVVVGHDGYSYWFDPSAKQKELETDPNLILRAIVGDTQSRQRLSNIQAEYTLTAPVPDMALQIIREELSPAYWADNFSAEFDARLGAILSPLFWEHINPYLTPQVEA